MAKKKPKGAIRDEIPLPAGKPAAWQDYRESFQALSQIERHLGREPGVALSLDLGSLCNTYRAIRGYIKTSLKFLEWLPHGETIRKVIEILMDLADQYCKAAPAALAAGAPAAAASAAALEDLRQALASPPARAASVGDDACAQYHRIKKYIGPALDAIEWLPYGTTIAKVIRVLTRLADAVC
jgi:hypothetical protein